MHLVTGGAGFIGSHIVAGLRARGEAVRVLDSFASGKRTNVPDDPGVEVIDADLRDPDAIRRAVEGVEVIFHHAAMASVPQSVADPAACFAINVSGTIDLYLAARDAGVRRVVFASSSAVYGDSGGGAKHETDRPAPISPYAISKLTGEQLGQSFTVLQGLDVVALRYFNVYGPGQDPNSQYAAVIPRFVAALRDGVAPTVYGDGEQSRDFVYVGDVVAANLLAATVDGAAGGVFNIGNGGSRSVNETLAEIARVMGVAAHAVHEPGRAGDVRMSQADIALARERLGFAPAMAFADGLEITVQAAMAAL